MTLISRKVRDVYNINVSNYMIRQILKDDMRLKWRKVVHQPDYINSEANIEKICQFAIDMIRLLRSQKVIINYDESMISGTCSK